MITSSISPKELQASTLRASCRASELRGKEVLPKPDILHCAHTDVAGQHRRTPAVAAPEGGRAAGRGWQLSGGQLGRGRCRGQQRCITCSASCRLRQQPTCLAVMKKCLVRFSAAWQPAAPWQPACQMAPPALQHLLLCLTRKKPQPGQVMQAATRACMVAQLTTALHPWTCNFTQQ